eukprot:SM000095S24944  [mRNA]  locus=s95:74480:76002:+ [translate_table: standard]
MPSRVRSARSGALGQASGSCRASLLELAFAPRPERASLLGRLGWRPREEREREGGAELASAFQPRLVTALSSPLDFAVKATATEPPPGPNLRAY